MSKPKKQTKKQLPPARPDGLPAIAIYNDLPLDNSLARQCLVTDKSGRRFRFLTRSHNHIVTAGIEEIFTGFDEFAEKVPTADIETCHFQLFGCLPSAKQDNMLTRLAVWKKLMLTAEDRTVRPTSVDANGEPRAPKGGKLKGRKYVLVTELWTAFATPQILVCLRIVRDLLASEGSEETFEGAVVRVITEERLKKEMYARSGELHTKQDAWRIFQFYRPRLIEGKILRLI